MYGVDSYDLWLCCWFIPIIFHLWFWLPTMMGCCLSFVLHRKKTTLHSRQVKCQSDHPTVMWSGCQVSQIPTRLTPESHLWSDVNSCLHHTKWSETENPLKQFIVKKKIKDKQTDCSGRSETILHCVCFLPVDRRVGQWPAVLWGQIAVGRWDPHHSDLEEDPDVLQEEKRDTQWTACCSAYTLEKRSA